MRILDFLFPAVCIVCGYPGRTVCRVCQQCRLEPYFVHFCHVCRHECRRGWVHTDCTAYTNLDGVVICYVYNDLARKLLVEAKYSLNFDILREVARLMKNCDLIIPPVEIVTFVPLSRRKLWKRGFNQTQLLANSLRDVFGSKPISLLRRTRHSHSQVGMGRAERLANLEGLFLSTFDLSGKSVLVVDDVMTTGSTLEHCALALKNSGAEKVYGIVFARGST